MELEKIFFLNSVLAQLPCVGELLTAVASSGIASGYLDGGRKSHATLKLLFMKKKPNVVYCIGLLDKATILKNVT